MSTARLISAFSSSQSKEDKSSIRDKNTMQKFYKAFSAGNSESKSPKIANLTANFKGESSMKDRIPTVDVKLNEQNVQNFLSKINAQSFPVIPKREKRRKADEHIYENVADHIGKCSMLSKSDSFRSTIEQCKDDYSLIENVTVIEIASSPESFDERNFKNYDSETKNISKVLQSFDQILKEYSPPPPPLPSVPAPISITSKDKRNKSKLFVPPKLQKSKTCSIIESRCILKSDALKQNKVSSTSDYLDHKPLDRTKSLWNLDDMEVMQLDCKAPSLRPLDTTSIDKKRQKYATYKVNVRSHDQKPNNVSDLPHSDLKRLDVKTRILKKTLSNPPSTPVPVFNKAPKKMERRSSDPKKKVSRQTQLHLNQDQKPKIVPKNKMQKAKSSWEVSYDVVQPKALERTKSSASISGSPSKIPIVRGQPVNQNRFGSTRAIFSSTPGNLSQSDQLKESGTKRRSDDLRRKSIDKVDVPLGSLRLRQGIQKNDRIKTDKDLDAKDNAVKSARDYANELSLVRAKLQKSKKYKSVASPVINQPIKADVFIDNPPKSPVKSIVSKLEMKSSAGSKVESNPLWSSIVNKAIVTKVMSTKSDIGVENTKMFTAAKKIENKKYDGSSDCSDDSGHVSNENEPTVDALDSPPKDNDVVGSHVARDKSKDGYCAAKDKEVTYSKRALVDAITSAASGKVEKAPEWDRPAYKMVAVVPIKPVQRRSIGDVVNFGSIGESAVRAAANGVDSKKEILFRGGALPALEAARDALLVERVARLQARCRGVLARRRATRLRVQHTAARCVQRNVRAFLAVRDWPWWRLLVRVQPLLEVNRTEDRLRITTEELENLRLKVEKLEAERSQLKHENGKLEAKLSETGAELAEERGAAALATQRLDAETSERLRIERDLRDLHTKNDKLQQTSERLELEVLHARGESASSVASDTESGADDGDAADRYRRRYERASRELNAARAQLRRQHEDDLEQIVGVKKQLEKKLADAYEEVDEQRQVAAGWKRKLQKLTNDMADLRSLLDEQTCRNNLLEKRQRKFDAELHSVQDELKRERSAKERTSRERDLAQAEKYALEQNLTDARMEVELKDEKIQSLQKELDEVGGGNGGDSELALFKKLKSDLEKKCHDQEEELDELAGQVQLLESSKLRLEMMLEQQRKESRIEAQQRDEELDEARSQAVKKVKALESQLETEHGERTLLLRERHELERRLASLEEQARSENSEMEQQLQRLRRDVKRYRALLRDAQAMIEQKDSDAGTRAQIRDLKAQLEEAEVAVRAAQRARAAAEQEACEASAAANEAQAARRDADQRATIALRDAAHTKSLLDDADEEAQELMKKYRACATSLSSEQASARALEAAREATEDEARSLRERLADAQQRLTQLEAGQEQDAAEHNKLLELKTKELESKLELEQTTRTRLEGQISRLKDSVEKINAELSSARQKEQLAQDELRKLQRQMKEMREEVLSLSSRLEEATRARAAAETRTSAAATEAAAARRDARTAQRRAADLQAALAADLSPNTDNSHEDSENDSYSSDESIETFLANHKLSPSTPSKQNFLSDNSRSTESRQSRSSAGSTKTSSPMKESFA